MLMHTYIFVCVGSLPTTRWMSAAELCCDFYHLVHVAKGIEEIVGVLLYVLLAIPERKDHQRSDECRSFFDCGCNHVTYHCYTSGITQLY
ncbi:hypothetical protein BX666DRAFT_1963869 [Dichotomocladium elegans]|nr:hypothetical protein BX666DRAFT_1963869 [Dichotomocladium elegans]